MVPVEEEEERALDTDDRQWVERHLRVHKRELGCVLEKF